MEQNSTTNTININSNNNQNPNQSVEVVNKAQNKEVRKIKVFRNDAGGYGFTLSRLNHIAYEQVRFLIELYQIFAEFYSFTINHYKYKPRNFELNFLNFLQIK